MMAGAMMRMPTANPSHSFSQIPGISMQRSVFDRSHSILTTFDAGMLVPFYVDDVLPGDTFQVDGEFFARLTTPLTPFMDNLYFETFFFFVPNRLVWSNWKKFMGEQANPGDSISYVVPKVTVPAAGYILGSLADYMGIPPGIGTGASVGISALPFRGYALIYNEFFRDQNLQASRQVLLNDGPEDAEDCGANIAPLFRGKRHDYFTSCLPAPQRGGAVSMFTAGAQARVETVAAAGSDIGVYSTPVGGTRKMDSDALFVDLSATTGDNPLFANLAAATATSINELRLAFQIQKLLERDARAGTRYIEIIWGHFRVRSSDARLQRPEYLGGGHSPINVTPIAQTSATGLTGGSTPAGNLTAVGTMSAAGGHGFVKSFEEHGYIIGICNVRADMTYSQGVERHWWRNTRYDFAWPELAHIGEQAVYNQEIFWTTNQAQNSSVFGYQERYGEYRYKQSQLTNLFRVDVAGSLSVWHLSQDFAALPVLDSTFILENPPVDRVVAVPAEPHFKLYGHLRVKAARPLPVFGVPGFIDHF